MKRRQTTLTNLWNPNKNTKTQSLCLAETTTDPKYICVDFAAEEASANNEKLDTNMENQNGSCEYLSEIKPNLSSIRLSENLRENRVMGEKRILRKRKATHQSNNKEIDGNFDATNNIEDFGENVNENVKKSQKLTRTRGGKNEVKHSKTSQKIYAPNYEIKRSMKNEKMVQRLFIFTSEQKTEFYEYGWYKPRKHYYCLGCFNAGKHIKVKASKEQIKNGKKFIEVNDKKHICEPRGYEPKKAKNGLVLKKPNYEIRMVLKNGEFKKRLIVFFCMKDEKQQKLCHEYFWDKFHQTYGCCECILLKWRITAKIYNIGVEDEEYLEIDNNKQHKCELREYNPEKYFDESKIVKAPNFKIENEIFHSKEYKMLIVFDKGDRNLCHKYTFRADGRICCQKCNSKGKWIKADLLFDDSGEQYVIIGNAEEHVCYLQPYQIREYKTIIEAHNFKHFTFDYKPSKLFLFCDENNKTMGYEFSHNSSNIYRCSSCIRKKTNTFTVNLFEKENGEKYVKIDSYVKHDCKMEKFVLTKYEDKRVYLPNFIFCFEKGSENAPNLIIYYSKNKELVYKYNYSNYSKYFNCANCKNLKVSAKVCINPDDGMEYIKKGGNEHNCKPINISLIQKPNIQFNEKSGGLARETPSTISECEKIKEGEYKFKPSKNGNPEGKVIIYLPNNKDMGYVFTFTKRSNNYFCNQCKEMGKRVSVKLFTDINGEKYLTYFRDKIHICEPIKYDGDNKKYYSFKVIENGRKKKHLKLIVFINEEEDDQNKIYECFWSSWEKIYYCCGCTNNKKYNRAKICKDADGIDFVQFSINEHFCIPRDYDKEKLQEK